MIFGNLRLSDVTEIRPRLHPPPWQATAGAPPFEWRETVFHAEVEPYYKRLWNNEFSGVSADLADTYEETPRLALARAMAHFFPVCERVSE